MTPLTMGKSLFILLSLPTSVVLTMDQSCYTTLVEQNTQSELILSGLGPSGVDPIVFDKFYDDAFNYTELFNVPYMWPFSGRIIQPAEVIHSPAQLMWTTNWMEYIIIILLFYD